MKRFLIPLFLILSASAFGFKLQWASNPTGELVTSYTVYDNASPVATVTPAAGAATQTWTIPTPSSGAHVYTVTATNLRGESGKSAPAALPDLPTAPVGLTLLP